MRSPYPYFGGKSKAAHLIWNALGDVDNYVEPFFGSGAVLLARPDEHQWWNRTETVNDIDGMIANFWRALQAEPDRVAEHADHPVNENDLHARHAWLVGQKDSLQARLEGDPGFSDPKIAGWWVWGTACWIGSGFCSGNGPWKVVNRQLVHLGDEGQGVNRKRVHLGPGRGVNRKRVRLSGFAETGVNARLDLVEYMRELADRMRRVRVCCGDWSRVCGPSVTVKHGLTGVFLDPPYSASAGRASGLYRRDSLTVAHDVRDWCLENGSDPLLRIVLAGYDREGHEALESAGWRVHAWKGPGGFDRQGDGTNTNRTKERLWLSPGCVDALAQLPLIESRT